MKHTAKPWTVEKGDEGTFYICDEETRCDETAVAIVLDEVKGRRIVACVNACVDMPVETLESPSFGVLETTVNRDLQELKAKRLSAQCYELIDLLKKHLADNPDGSDCFCICSLCQETRTTIARIEASR